MVQPAVATQPGTSPAYPDLSGVGLGPVTVEHPAWCNGMCELKVMRGGVREIAHHRNAFEITMATPDGAETAIVAMVRVDSWDADGNPTGDFVTAVVIDGDVGSVCLTAAAAAEVASALFSVSLQAR